MLKARNLDDQTYEEIVQAAEGRLPWLCPVWTDHNAHDPGITILELMAWYKELQQYHMNQFTDELRCKLLKLAGITRRPAAPALSPDARRMNSRAPVPQRNRGPAFSGRSPSKAKTTKNPGFSRKNPLRSVPKTRTLPKKPNTNLNHETFLPHCRTSCNVAAPGSSDGLRVGR